jgi:uncharacterized protein
LLDFSLIHKFKIEDTCIVLDINSGAVHELSPEAYDFLEAWEDSSGDGEKAVARLNKKYPEGELREIWQEMVRLQEEGMLFSRDRSLASYQPRQELLVKALCLHAAHDCNLRCRYCFGGTGDFGGQRTLMDLETGKKALDFLFLSSGTRKHLEVDYFGGEPLLNFQVVKELIRYGKRRAAEEGKVLNQTLTTNSTLLDQEKARFLQQEKINVILSTDGRPEINNFMRPYPGGKPSHEAILSGIKAYTSFQEDNTYYVRGTYTRFNLDFCQDIFYLVQQGIRRISLEPVVAPPDQDYALKKEDLPLLRKEYLKLARFWLECWEKGQPLNFFHFNVSLDKGPCLLRRLTGCGAGNEYLAVSPEGDLYPCHQFVGDRDFKLGTVEEGITNHQLRKTFQNAHVLNKSECRQCWARFYCSGGCHANAYYSNRDLFKPYELGCDLQKMRLEYAIYLQVKINQQSETLERGILPKEA